MASLRNRAPHGIRDAGVTRELWLINSAYAAGADQELEACCREVDCAGWVPSAGSHLRAIRRPKPQTLAEQGMEELELLKGDTNSVRMGFGAPAITAALNRLAELEAQQ